MTGIVAARSAVRLSLAWQRVETSRQDGWHRVAVTGTHGDEWFLALFATPLDNASSRSLQRIVWQDGELSTDARALVFRVTGPGDPCALTLIDGRIATWTGQGAFDVETPAAADLHLDGTALAARTRLDARCG